MTPIWIEGFEHGVLSTAGGGIVNAISGTVGTNIAVTADAKRTGGYGLRVYPAVSTLVNITKNVTATILVGRFYVKLPSTLPTADHQIARAMTASQQMIFGYNYNAGSPRFYMMVNAGTPRYFSGLAADTWYRVDFRFDVSGATSTIDWQIDGVDQTQATRTVAASSITIFNLGISIAAIGNVYYDDVVLSATTGDYPIGAGAVVGLSPNAAGASNLDTNIEDNGSVDVNDSTNPANIELDDVPFNGSDYIKQIGGASTLYAAVAFADTAETTIHGAQAFLAYTSAAASPANSASAKIYDEDGVETDIFTGDMSESSAFYKSVICRTPTGGWDQAAVNALQGRVGYATDYAPVPYWQGLMIQVAYAEGAGYTLAVEPGSYALSGQEVGILADHKIAMEVGDYALGGLDVGTLLGRKLAIEVGDYVLTGQAAEFLRAARIGADGGTYILSGLSADVLFDRLISLGAGAYVLAGQDVTLVYVPGGGAYIITADGGIYAVTGQGAGVLLGRRLAAETGSHVIVGQAADLLRDGRLAAEAGGVVLIGGDLGLVYSGVIPPVVIGRRQAAQGVPRRAPQGMAKRAAEAARRTN